MLTLEQVSAVDDGFHRGDLNAALAPLEETIDLRVNELPRLDKRAVAALKNGLARGDDAATWAQAVLHPNISVRRFARKVLLPLGDEAAPLFAPLRARLERFWGEEAPLPETNKPREAAARREQNEQVESALELLLRCDPEAFLEFYAQLADSAPIGNERADEWHAWQERRAVVWKATQDETLRLLRDEWGEKFAESSERYKLPSRVLHDLDERARQKPAIAALLTELGEAPWLHVAPTWNASGLVFGTWNSYLNAEKPTGPIEAVNARLRPVLWDWLRGAFNFEHGLVERQKLARRLDSGGVAYQIGGWIGRERLVGEVPTLLMQSKARLLAALHSVADKQRSAGNRAKLEGEEVVAQLWANLAWGVGRNVIRPYGVKAGEWSEMPAIEPQTLRDLAQKLPEDRKIGMGRRAIWKGPLASSSANARRSRRARLTRPRRRKSRPKRKLRIRPNAKS